ncbi:MAG: hypothetical protein AAB439_01560 [Patescibacteria group bacterium]
MKIDAMRGAKECGPEAYFGYGEGVNDASNDAERNFHHPTNEKPPCGGLS